MITIYSADVCPFAHRTRALLTHLGIEFEHRKVNLRDRDKEFLKLTPTGKVPLYVDGDVKLYESVIINDYIAASYGMENAHDPDLYREARVRLAMMQWDNVVLPAFYNSLRNPDSLDDALRDKLGRELDELQETVGLTSLPVVSVFGFHFGPFWARMDWLRHLTPFPELVDARGALKAFLDRRKDLPAVQATLPEKGPMVKSYEERFAKVT